LLKEKTGKLNKNYKRKKGRVFLLPTNLKKFGQNPSGGKIHLGYIS